MEKEFIPYEQALALKKLGFDEPCFGYFNTTSYLGIGSFVFKECDKNTIDGYGNKPLLRPTFSQAFRFFREKHNLIGGFQYMGGLKPETTWWDIYVVGHFNTSILAMTMKYQPYEKAELACLKKLIEIIKEKQNDNTNSN